MKKILSMFLVLCMVLTMLPVAVMAEEGNGLIGTKGEIITFIPLDQTEKTVTEGTAMDDLELPPSLTAKVRTSFDSEAESLDGSEDGEAYVNIPVAWISQPEYDKNTQGEYVFTPVIEEYLVSAELPKIKVTVEAALQQSLTSLTVGTVYDIWVGGVQVTSENMSGEGWSYTPAKEDTPQTLTLNDAEIKGKSIDAINDDNSYGIYAKGDLNLVLEGSSFVYGGKSSADSFGIYVCRAATDSLLPTLTISGRGNLLVSGEKATASSYSSSYGIGLDGNLVIKTVENDTGGCVLALGGEAKFMSNGIFLSSDSSSLFIEDGSYLSVLGSEAENSFGIHLLGADSQINVKGGSLIAKGDVATKDSYGILAMNDVIINDGEVEAGSSEAGEKSCGIYGREITINGGSVSVSGDTATKMRYGIFSLNDLIITGGVVEAINDSGAAINKKPVFQIDDSYSGFYKVRAGASLNDSTFYDITVDETVYTNNQYVKIEPYTEYDIWVAGVQVTSANKHDVLGNGKISYTPSVKGKPQILTLNGLESFTGSYTDDATGNNYGIYANGSLQLVLWGDNNIAIPSPAENKDSIGVYTNGNLTITGFGKLVVTGGAPQGNGDSYGILVDNGELTVENISLIASGAPAVGSYCASYGIKVNGNLTINQYGKVTAKGYEAGRFSSGVYLNGSDSILTVEKGGSLIATGGGDGDSLGEGYSYGIYFSEALNSEASTKLTVNGGRVVANALSVNGEESGGILAGGVTINGGRVEANGGSTDNCEYSVSFGISSQSLTLKGGKLEASSSEAGTTRAISSPSVTFDSGYVHRNNAGNNGADAVFVDDSTFLSGLNGYKYVEIESPYAVLIGEEYYDTLQKAVDAVFYGQRIDLLNDLDLAQTVVIDSSNDNNFTLGLNGYKLNGGNNCAINHKGTGTLTIVSNDADGEVTSANGEFGTILLEGGSLELQGGKVTNTLSTSLGAVAIHNHGDGDVLVFGNGSVTTSGIQACAIYNNGGGDVTVSDKATVNVNGDGAFAIYNIVDDDKLTSGGDVIITGGVVSATGEGSQAIFNNSNGEVNVSGGAVSANGVNSCAIFNNDNGEIIVYGGTISATGAGSVGIFASDPNTRISIPTGSPIIKGTGMAMNIAPDLTNYAKVKVIASQEYSGTPTAFYNPEQITAYRYLAFTANSSSGGSGSSGKSSDKDSSGIASPGESDQPTKAEIKISGTVDGDGNVTVNMTSKTVSDAFEKALAEAKKNGNEENGISLILNVNTGNKTAGTISVNLLKDAQDTNIAKKIVDIIVVVDNSDLRVGLDLATVKEINKQTKSDVKLSVTRRSNSTLSGEARNAIGSRPVFDFQLSYGGGEQVRDFGKGRVTITIPYTLSVNEKAENICAVYVDENGKVHWLFDSIYDKKEKVLRFTTSHFSTYGVGYKENSSVFTDIEGHWAKENIECVVREGLFSGTSASTFSPNLAMTRGMFVTVLGKLAGADVDSYKKSSFSDVQRDTYYLGYIEWASKNDIVKGLGNGKFAPNQPITREQMAVIMSNYVGTMNLKLPQAQEEKPFADGNRISTYAKEAVRQMQTADILNGKNSNLFDPQGTATRAEVATVLHHFLELTDSDHSR